MKQTLSKNHNFRNLTDKRFGKLTVIEITGRNKYKKVLWLCRCDCGNEKVLVSSDLLQGKVRSCGCLIIEAIKKRCIKHNRTKTPEYHIFQDARRRCQNPDYSKYHNYGGRGIEFRFGNFNEFFKELGERPSKKHSLDRINNNGHYEKGNVRWATKEEQQENRRTTPRAFYNGKTRTAKEISELTGVSPRIIARRIRWGYCPDCMVSLVKKRCPHKLTG